MSGPVPPLPPYLHGAHGQLYCYLPLDPIMGQTLPQIEVSCTCTSKVKEIQFHLHNFGILFFIQYPVQKSTVYGTLVLIIFHRILFKNFVCLRFQIIHEGLKGALQIIFISSCICHQRVCMRCALKIMFNKTGNIYIT